MAHINGTPFPDLLIGTLVDDRIDGAEGDDVIFGLAGNDVLIGGPGNDTMDGGTGNDHFFVDISAGDRVNYFPVFGGERYSAIVLSITGPTASIEVTIGATTEIRQVNIGTLTSSDEVIERVGEGDDTVHTSVSYILGEGAEVETLITTNAAGIGEINLTGNEFGQSIYANAGNNHIDGGGGIDYMLGLAGNDRYRVDTAADLIVENAGEGDDAVNADVSYTLRAGVSVETMTTTHQFSTAALDLTGNELGQSLYGNDGNNVLDGRGGIDYFVGLGGNDTFIVDSSFEHIAEAAGQGDDTVRSSTNYTLREGVSVETMTTTNAAGSDAIDLTGNELGQSIYGNAGANTLLGLGGADYLVGGGGADHLDGGSGNDYLRGDAGADRFVFTQTPGNDTVMDFTTSVDKIDLSAFDISRTNVTSTSDGANTILAVDSNKDGAADFTITLIGTGVPADGDFLF